MRIDLFLTPQQTEELALRDKRVVVIDVLRASTTIITALANGAREVIPVSSIERAVKVSGSLFGDAILRGGERNGRMIEGFNLGNSPGEYTEERVKGKAIIFCTTNGSYAIERARHARQVAICGFVNLKAVARFVRSGHGDLVVMCAGKSGAFSLEDTVCAGMFIRTLEEMVDGDMELTDAALAAVSLHRAFGRSIVQLLKKSEHGKYLSQIGFASDLAPCASVDSIPVVPQLINNAVRLKVEAAKSEVSPAT